MPPYPRHSERYREIYKLKQAMQEERIGGFKEFIDDVRQNRFPAKQHVINAPENLIGDFLSAVEKE